MAEGNKERLLSDFGVGGHGSLRNLVAYEFDDDDFVLDFATWNEDWKNNDCGCILRCLILREGLS
jgi:hypothetical protein